MSRPLRHNGPVELFRRFHGKKPQSIKIAPFHDPQKLIFLGRAVAVIYEIDKENGGGDGTVAEYIHEFETPVGLFMDERGKKALYLLGKDLIVTKAGIEN